MNRFILAGLSVLLVLCAVALAKETAPVTINPTVTTIDSTLSQSIAARIFINSVTDTSIERQQQGKVGETRKRRNSMAPVLSLPVPSVVVHTSLTTLLTACNAYAENEETADLVIDITILDFSLKETSKKLTQTMDASVKCSVKITDKNNASANRQFTVATQNTYSTIDTSKHAERILKGALIDALKEIKNNLPR